MDTAFRNTVNIETLAECAVDGMCFQALRWSMPTTMAFHEHPHGHFVLVLSGAVKDARRRGQNVRGPNWLSYLPAGEAHATESTAGCDIFQFVVTEAALSELKEPGLRLEEPAEFEKDAPSWLARRMAEELMQGDDLSRFMLKGLGLELLTLATRAKRTDTAEHPVWLKRARDYLHAHFAESISIDELAAAVSVHPAHLMRCFRREFSCTIGDYVRKLRVEYACQLLRTSDYQLSAVASSAGYADQSHFIRAFRAATGMTPSAFQRAIGNATPIQ